MQNLLYKLNVLGDLFSEEDFNFLSNSSSIEKDIQSKIDETSSLRDLLVSYISKLKISDSLSNEEQLNLSKAQEAFEKINSVIMNLYDLQNEIQEIEKNILEIIVKKEEHKISEDELNESINKIKNDISKYDTFFKTSDSINQNSIDFVKDFLTNCKDINYSNDTNKVDDKKNQICVDSNCDSNKSFDDFKVSDDLTLKKETDNTSIYDNDYLNIENILNNNISDNLTLRISEKDNKVYLPYTKDEIVAYVKEYPNVYKNAQAVIDRDYIINLSFYSKHPVLARFRETYALLHDREMKSFADSLKGAIDLMFKGEINPAIIAGLKSESQLNEFLECLQNNDLDNFKPFKIIFEFNPSKIYLGNN